MHGRIKVKTTAVQQEEKRIEREKKAKAFTGGMKKVFENRGCEEKAEEMLKLSEKLLSGNPDVYTLWNMRKEIFVTLQKEKNIDDILGEELKFLQNCLHVNPKSYGVWNQRQFVMNIMHSPNWFEELQLCNLFLKYDERNFHCWDYRRFVVGRSNVSAVEELEYTMKKITDNFSNYSAWHNRSKLLPLVHPDPGEKGRVDETTLLKEFQLAQNAFFTDPNDQSAWFYQRWLLGRREVKPRLLSVSIHRTPLSIVASFSHPVNLLLPTSSDLSVNGEKVTLNWKATEEICSGINVDHSCVWMCCLTATTEDVKIMLAFPEIETCPESLELLLAEGHLHEHLRWTVDELSSDNGNVNMFSDYHTVAKASVLEGELEALNMLLEEEPDNKWTMLTIIYLMRALDGGKYQKETEGMLCKLMKADATRIGYYKDLRSKYRIEDQLQRLSVEQNSLEEIDLSGLELSSFYYGQYFASCKLLNLNNNDLGSTSFCSLLIGVEKLLLVGNPSINAEDVRRIFASLPFNVDVEL